MSERAVLRVQAVSKRYEIYERPHERLLQSLRSRAASLGARIGLGTSADPLYREFWALRDISFDVMRGEAVGIIGRNGAGKSTLLQIIAGTLTPTAGGVQLDGRAAALLELGSGFSPDFTGEENVRLNAALLGLNNEQIEQRFDEILAFADIGEFINQPVKTYSSGMLMRLAFAVQTAVEPELLIVDEALSVGDIFFQAKCMARLRRLRDRGVAMLFVSHDTGTIRQLCDRAVLLDHGVMRAHGAAGEVADQYLRVELEARNAEAAGRATAQTGPDPQSAPAAQDVRDAQPPSQPQAREDASTPKVGPLYGQETFIERARYNRIGNGSAQILNVQLLKNGVPCDLLDFDDRVTLRQVVRFSRTLSQVNVSYKIRTLQGTDAVFGDTRLAGKIDVVYRADTTYILDWQFRVPMLHGNYTIFAALAHPPAAPGDDWRFIDVVPICYEFRVAPRAAGMVDGLVVWPAELSVQTCEVEAMAQVERV